MGGQKDKVIEEAEEIIKASNIIIGDRNTKIEKAEIELTGLTKVRDRILEGKEQLADQFSKMDGYSIEEAVEQMIEDMYVDEFF